MRHSHPRGIPLDYEERENFIESNLLAWGREAFPDDPDINWPVGRIDHSGDCSYVESEPDPPEVGYPMFKFVIDFRNAGKPKVLGCYVQDSSDWSLLFGKDPMQLHPAPPTTVPRGGCFGVLVLIVLMLAAMT